MSLADGMNTESMDSPFARPLVARESAQLGALSEGLVSPFEAAFTGESGFGISGETEEAIERIASEVSRELEAFGYVVGEDRSEDIATEDIATEAYDGEHFAVRHSDGEDFAAESSEGEDFEGQEFDGEDYEAEGFDGEDSEGEDFETEAASHDDFGAEHFAAEHLAGEHTRGCARCGRKQAEREGPEFEHDVAPLSSVARDYSLKSFADNITVAEDIKTAILSNGEADVLDLTKRAFAAAHPEVKGPLEKSGSRHAKLRLKYRRLRNQIRALIWLRQVIAELDKHRGDLPRYFLLGWMAVESDGHVDVVTSRPERGYFQIDWKGGEAKEQLGLSAAQFRKLSTDRAFSIKTGIALVERYRNWVVKNYPSVAAGSDTLWRLTKARHAASGTLKKVLDKVVKQGVTLSWDNIAPEVPAFMRKNVNATLDYAGKLKPFADLVPEPAPAGSPELFAAPAFAHYRASEFAETEDESFVETEDESFETALTSADDDELEPWGEAEASAGFGANGELLLDSELLDSELLRPGFVRAVLPRTLGGPSLLRNEWSNAELEEHQVAAPKGLALQVHMQIPKTPSAASPGTFTRGSLSALTVADQNPGFIDPSDALITDKTSTGLQTCLSALITSRYQGLLGSSSQTAAGLKDHVRVAVVDLTGNKLSAPDFAGWGSTVAIYGASVPKILALYGAFQLRSDLREMITRLAPADGLQLEKAALKAWKAKGGRAPLPDLVWLFNLRRWTSGTTLDFTAAAQSTFANIMHNCPAGTLIAKVSLPFIASVTWQSGIFHPTRGGLWLKSAYCGKGSWSSPVKAPHSANATALSAATYFTLLAQGRLVDDAASAEIKTSLQAGCLTSLFPSLPVVASKCGIYKGYVHDCAWIEDVDVRYAVAVMSRLETTTHSSLYTQLCSDVDQLVRNNNKTPKVPC